MNKTVDQIIDLAKSTLKIEADAINNLQNFVDESFAKVVKLIHNSEGRVVVTGIGKSAIIAQKIVATFNSTGTPSVFMHAADAIHGDLGTLQQNDTVICISKSGNTQEIKVLVPLLKLGGNKLIALVGNTESYLANNADYILNATVEKEACPNNLAPTSSTSAQLALGDALAVCLLDYKQFKSSDFAKFHPGGSLGKKLYLKVEDLSSQNKQPKVNPNDSLKSIIMEISSNLLGATAVIDDGKLVGVITDGDLRRMMETKNSFDSVQASDIMNRSPKNIEADSLAIDALRIIEQYSITQLVVTKNGEYAGFIHLHDLLREGII